MKLTDLGFVEDLDSRMGSERPAFTVNLSPAFLNLVILLSK